MTTHDVVENPARAPKTEVVRLTELWRIGEEDDDVVFGQIGGMVVDDDGRLYVPDLQARQIAVFSSSGEFLRNLGREGEGPGEFREPSGLVVLSDGLIGVVSAQPPAIVCFQASDGEFVRNLHLEEVPQHPFQRLGRVVYRGSSIIATASDFRASPEGMNAITRLLRFDTTGKFVGECDSIEWQFLTADPIVRERHDISWQVGPDGQAFINPGPEYGFQVRGKDCGLDRVIARKYKRLKRTAAEMDSVESYYRRVGNIGNAKLEISDHVRDVMWFSVDDAGRLWVLNSRGRLDLPADSLAHFDVYDTRGRLDRVVDLKAERGARDGYFMHRDRFYVVHRETMSVVAYAMPKLRP